jgi:pimeloyl-ACP methyl ester carboxylesterase
LVEATSILTHKALEKVFKHLNNLGYYKIGLFGISFGGNISIELALRYKIDLLILINPVIDYFYFRKKQLNTNEFEKLNQNKEITIEYTDGKVRFSYDFILEAIQQDLKNRINILKGKILLFQSENDEFNDLLLLKEITNSVPYMNYFIVPNSSHSFKEEDAIQFFIEKVKKFIQNTII